jgi:hypothetical protein
MRILRQLHAAFSHVYAIFDTAREQQLLLLVN